MLRFITGGAGCGKSTRLMEKIKEFSDNKRELCIIVPEQFSYEFDKNLYKYLGAEQFNKLFSLTFTSLARQIFQLYGDIYRTGVYADELRKIIVIQEALVNVSKSPDGLLFFNKQIKRQEFIADILKLIGDLKRSNISPTMLSEKTVFTMGKLKNKTNDIVNIYTEYEKILADYGLKDNLNDISESAKIANTNRYFKNKTIFIDEFESFNGDQYEMLKIMIAEADDVYISLRTEDADADEFTLFETVNRTYRRLVEICREIGVKFENDVCNNEYRYKYNDLLYLSRNILRAKQCRSSESSENIHIFEARDYYSECEYVCASIKHMIYENQDLHYSNISIISNNIADYSGVLEAAFERYEIPYFFSIEKSVSHTSLMVFMSSIVNILTSSKYNSEEIFRYIKSGLSGISLTDISMLENYCYKWGIDGDKWNRPFTAFDDKLEAVEKIRNGIITPLEKLKKGCQNSSATIISQKIYEHIIGCGADKKISMLISECINQNKDYLASEIKRIWSCMINILDSLSSVLEEKKIGMAEYNLLFSTLLSQIKYSVPPQTLDSVTVASARTARLNSPKVVFVIGANEGSFPNSINMHELLTEEDKSLLYQNGGLEISRPIIDLIASERLVVYKSLSIASESLYITYPLSDLSGQAKYPALVIRSVMDLFENGSKLLVNESEIPPHFYAVTKRSAFYHFMQSEKERSVSVSSIKEVLSNDEFYKAKMDYIYNRASSGGEFSINQTGLMEKLIDFYPFTISSTKLEMYNMCHFKYFCNYCLRLFEREKVQLDNLSSGTIIHRCFYNLVSERSKDEFVSMDYDGITRSIKNTAEEYKKEIGADTIDEPRFDFNYDKLSQQLVKVAIHLQQELMVSDFVPVEFEYDIKNNERSNLLRLNFDGEKELEFSGIIDRVDTCKIDDKQYVRIVDYKSSRKEIDPVYVNNGINMQMLLYLFTITEKDNAYYKSIPAGVLYLPTKLPAPRIDEKKPTENTSYINGELKMSGLLTNDLKVLDAMENGIGGKYIPAKVNKSRELDIKSNCISDKSFEMLRDFSYGKLVEMANSIKDGDIKAAPFIYKNTRACSYCHYTNICGNNSGNVYANRINEDTSEIENIFNYVEESRDENNGLD